MVVVRGKVRECRIERVRIIPTPFRLLWSIRELATGRLHEWGTLLQPPRHRTPRFRPVRIRGEA